MPNLTERLAQLIIQDNAVLFVGTGLQLAESETPALQQIADILAQRINYQRPERSLPAVARDYEVLQGRTALVLALREELQKFEGRPAPIYQLIADAVLPTTKIVTTRFDRALEHAFDQFQKPYVIIVRDTDVPFFDESKITLIKMQGDVNQPDSLVITEDDIEAFISRLPTISDVVRAFFATKTLIFLGYDLNDAQFKRFYRQVTRNLSQYRRRAYALVPAPLDEVETRYWDGQNVEVQPVTPAAFLEELAQQVKAQAQSKAPRPNPLLKLAETALPPRPYKALESFTEADEAIFTSRLEESYRLTNRILGHRLTVLYGESGSGKTSLLQAGAGPRLARNRALLSISIPAPGQALPKLLRQNLLEAGANVGLTPPEDDGLLALLRQWQQTLSAPIALAFDQFEQFFLAYSPTEQETVAGFLADLLNDRSLDLRLVFIIREDFLGRLDTLKESLPGLLEARFRLERLGREAARSAIEEPARLFNITWESALVETLLETLYAPSGGGVAPPQLQLVCDALYQHLLDEQGSAIQERGAQITLARFEALGGVEAILGDYLSRALNEFSPQERPQVEMLLGALVSSAGVKQRLPLTELARTANLTQAQAGPLLDRLTAQRLLQRYEAKPEGAETPFLEYELTHDYLVNRIADWLGSDFWATQKVRELLREALPEWEARGRLLPLEDLRLTEMHQARIHFSPAEGELLYATAVSYNEDTSLWQSLLSEERARAILLQLLSGPASFRPAVLRQMANFAADDEVATALAQTALSDADAPSREIALKVIAGQNGQPVTPAINQLVSATADPAQRDAALSALSVIRDLAPQSHNLLPQNLRQPLQRRAWKRRFRRSQNQILRDSLRGAQAGFWGVGVMMGTFFGLFSGLSAFQGQVQFRFLLGTVLLGLALTGMLGALSIGPAVFAQSVMQHLQDRPRPWLVWIAVTLPGGLAFAGAFLLLSYVTPTGGGQLRIVPSLIAGLMMGLGLVGVAQLPLNLAWPLRLGITVLAGVGIFIAVGLLGLAFNDNILWLSLMGGAAGLAFFIAFWGSYNPLTRGD